MIKFLENENEFEKEINKELVLVDFYADWCGPCKMLGKVIEKLDDIDVLKINVDKFPDLAQKYGIMSIPTVILFKDKEQQKKSIGFMSLDELKEFIK